MHIDVLYVDILTYSDFLYLYEDNAILGDIIKQGKEYSDYVKARKELCAILAGTCNKIEKLNYIKYCNPNPSDDETEPGLSVYMNIMFKHPNGLTEEEINENYRYSIRFSDHKDRHKRPNRKQIKLVGKKVENLANTAWAIFNSQLRYFQKKIKDFETEKFGEQKTFITDTPKNKVDEVYTNQANMMTIRNQLMNKLGDDFKVTGGSTVPKIIVASEQRPSITFEITPNGQNVDIVPKYDNIPDTVHKKRGIAYMRAANILYDFIMNTIKTKSERVERKMKLTIKESTKGEYFVGVFDKDQVDNEYDRVYVEQQTFKDRQSAWEFALKWNLKGFYVDFASNETVEYGDDNDYYEDSESNEYTYEPYEMKDTFNSIHESWEDPENFSYLDDPFSELKSAINNYFKEYHDPVHTKVYFKDLNYDDIWAMDMKVSAYDGTSNKTYSLEYRDPYDGILYVRPQNGSWETFYDFKSFLDWLDEDLDNLF